MDISTFLSSGKAIDLLGEAGGVVGLICGFLLLYQFYILKHMVANLEARDRQLYEMNKKFQDLVTKNTTAINTLARIIQSRTCMANHQHSIEQINHAVVAHPGKNRKRDHKS